MPLMDAYVLGVDGCRSGWLVCRYESKRRHASFTVCSNFGEILNNYRDAECVAVDIPIGLRADRHPRRCDVEARRLLAPLRTSSVFPAPPRCLLGEANYAAACERSRELFGKGISKQSHAIYPKIAEVDELMTPEIQKRVVEVHPEVCFWGVDNRAMSHGKKTPEGYEERRRLLEVALGHKFPQRALWRSAGISTSAEPDDLLDAAVAALTAFRATLGKAARLPDQPEIDEMGLRMEMNY